MATPSNQDPMIWRQEDAVALRRFITDNPKFLIALGRRRPRIEGLTMEARAVTGSESLGYMTALENIDDLQRDPVQSTEEAGFID